jgi:hypothetical protein
MYSSSQERRRVLLVHSSSQERHRVLLVRWQTRRSAIELEYFRPMP